MRFFGGPADGLRLIVPGGIREVRIPVIRGDLSVAQAIYTRYELADGPAMVCPGAWPMPRARE